MTGNPVGAPTSTSQRGGPATGGAASSRSRPKGNYAPLLPFLAYVGAFLIAPTLIVTVGAFSSPNGGFTLDSIDKIFTSETFVDSFVTSIELALATPSQERSSEACSPGPSSAAIRTGSSDS